jgi:WD40 repeat protein
MDEEHQLAHDLRIVNSFGVGTARYCSCWPSTLASSGKGLAQEDPHSGTTYVDVPLGCNIVRWDIDRRERVRFFRPHGDIVTCMLKTDDFIFTASEAGEVALWDHDWRLLDRSHHATRRVKVTHAALSPCRRRIVTTSEHADGIATLFKVYRDYATPEQQLRLVKVLEFGAGAGYTFVEWADSGQEPDALLLVAVRQPPRASRHSAEGPSTQHSETALHLIRVDERSGEWRVIKERALEVPSVATRSSAVSVSAMAKEDRPSTDGGPVRMAIALSGRRVEVVDMRTLATLWTVDASGGSGLIKCLAFKSAGDRLLCPGDNARLTVWQRDRLAGEFVLDGTCHEMTHTHVAHAHAHAPAHKLLTCSDDRCRSVQRVHLLRRLRRCRGGRLGRQRGRHPLVSAPPPFVMHREQRRRAAASPARRRRTRVRASSAPHGLPRHDLLWYGLHSFILYLFSIFRQN